MDPISNLETSSSSLAVFSPRNYLDFEKKKSENSTLSRFLNLNDSICKTPCSQRQQNQTSHHKQIASLEETQSAQFDSDQQPK